MAEAADSFKLFDVVNSVEVMDLMKAHLHSIGRSDMAQRVRVALNPQTGKRGIICPAYGAEEQKIVKETREFILDYARRKEARLT